MSYSQRSQWLSELTLMIYDPNEKKDMKSME